MTGIQVMCLFFFWITNLGIFITIFDTSDKKFESKGLVVYGFFVLLLPFIAFMIVLIIGIFGGFNGN